MPTNPLDFVLDGLMRRYRTRVPAVGGVIRAMLQSGLIHTEADIENDHIAFRTLGVPHLGIQSLEKIFLHCGYDKREHYYFEGKKLDAYWYSPPQDHYPRIFISELRVGDLSPPAQSIRLIRPKLLQISGPIELRRRPGRRSILTFTIVAHADSRRL
ncbi:MAG: DUF1338 family protein [Pirellulaceae bacterium]